MRLEPIVPLSKGVAKLKEITPTDYVLALTLAIEKYGNIAESDVESEFWWSVWWEQGLIELQGEFTEDEFTEDDFNQVRDKFFSLNASLYKPQSKESRHVEKIEKANKHSKKSLKEVAQDVQTDCAIFISQYNYQAIFTYGFTFIQQLQKLHKK